MEYALEMRGINKSFSGTRVLKDVDISVEKGHIHALVGENGAGKSTLMNILGGVLPMDSGQVLLFGEEVMFSSPAAAQEKGIAFVHQELNVVNDLPVYENMFLGHELRKGRGMIDARAMITQTVDVFKRIHVDVDPKAMVRDLDATSKQIIEIAKSVLFHAKLIILDEPTTSLTGFEVENVFNVMRNLTSDQGVTILFISHKLGEVVEFCDKVTVLRNGELVDTCVMTKADGALLAQSDIARMMVGKNVLDVEVYRKRELGEVILSVEGLHVGSAVKGVSFELHKGEILGITGLLGDGKNELVGALFGDEHPTAGTITKDGQTIRPKRPADARKLGIGLLPTNRKENAIIPALSVTDNMTIVTLEDYVSGFTMVRGRETKIAEQFKERLNIKVERLSDLIVSLSGGNQQKVVLAKWLIAKPDIMILSNPTQGVDVGAKNEIYHLIMELAQEGVGIIVTSGEAQEVQKICDRVLVMYHGDMTGELEREELSEESIMILSTGGSLGQ
ncbi:ribose import ATP-binding protein RbsA [Clostridia bacterium]|nr:ribose import ATP-binding protein RbsA [Clostridia bacterium]